MKKTRPPASFFLALACALLLAASARAQNQFDFGHRAPPSKEDPAAAKAAEEALVKGRALAPVLGKIVWVDASGRHAVAWLKQRPFPAELRTRRENEAVSGPILREGRLLGVRGANMEPLALLRLAQNHTGDRAVGLVVERGAARKGLEIVLPDDALLEQLRSLAPHPEEPPPPPPKAKAPPPAPKPPVPSPAASVSAAPAAPAPSR
jgi:hypothetical protein